MSAETPDKPITADTVVSELSMIMGWLRVEEGYEDAPFTPSWGRRLRNEIRDRIAMYHHNHPYAKESREPRKAYENHMGIIHDARFPKVGTGQWRKTPPTEPGWYWCRRDGAVGVVQVEEWHRLIVRMPGETDSETLERVSGWEWFSERIAEPPA